jgi:hypothetical protein
MQRRILEAISGVALHCHPLGSMSSAKANQIAMPKNSGGDTVPIDESSIAAA